ncbi:hypothetical protein [Nonomuraea sp. B19D2]|uniref:hypothetical protein n=1 Tax=Nonomuraea sp. B19D2 TaxID=3159561 RepID=UPI0032DA9408
MPGFGLCAGLQVAGDDVLQVEDAGRCTVAVAGTSTWSPYVPYCGWWNAGTTPTVSPTANPR